MWTGVTWFRIQRVIVFCEQSVSTEDGIFLDQLGDRYLFNKDCPPWKWLICSKRRCSEINYASCLPRTWTSCCPKHTLSSPCLATCVAEPVACDVWHRHQGPSSVPSNTATPPDPCRLSFSGNWESQEMYLMQWNAKCLIISNRV